MLVDKIKMKNIIIKESYVDIEEDNFKVETDMKRL